VAVRKTTLSLEGPVDNVRADVEHGRCVGEYANKSDGSKVAECGEGPEGRRKVGRTLLVLLLQVVVERVVRAVGTVVVGEAVGRNSA